MIATQLKNSIYCAIDMGTSSIKTVIAQKNSSQDWNVLGFGIHPSEGIKKGCIINLEKTIQSVRYSIEEAELKAGTKAQTFVTNVAGPYFESMNTRGVIPIRHTQVLPEDIEEVINVAKNIPLSDDQKILHAIPQYYAIDHHRQIRDPLHMPGIRLEVEMHLVTASVHAMRTKLQVLSHFGIQANYVVLDSIAAACSRVLNDEKELGVAVLDIGAGTSKMSIFHQNILISSKVIPIGGDHITADLALAFRTPVAAAEVLKMRHGGVHTTAIQNNFYLLNIPTLGANKPQQIMRSDVLDVITPRMEEIFELFLEDVEQKNISPFISSGIVLTGGVVQLEHIAALAQKVFQVPVRVGRASCSSKSYELLASPLCATVMGLLEWAYINNQQTTAQKKTINIMWTQLRNWLTG
jgi:cell division protein FtsA